MNHVDRKTLFHFSGIVKVGRSAGVDNSSAFSSVNPVREQATGLGVGFIERLLNMRSSAVFHWSSVHVREFRRQVGEFALDVVSLTVIVMKTTTYHSTRERNHGLFVK